MDRQIIVDFHLSIERGNIDHIKTTISETPEILNCQIDESSSWLCTASYYGHFEIVKLLYDNGCDVNSFQCLGTSKSSAVSLAIDKGHINIAEFLLKCGANPNLEFDRPLVSAVNPRFPADQRLEMVKLLVHHGADINRLYDLFGDMDRAFTVLDWTSDPAVTDFLRANGAKTAAQLKAEKGKAP